MKKSLGFPLEKAPSHFCHLIQSSRANPPSYKPPVVLHIRNSSSYHHLLDRDRAEEKKYWATANFLKRMEAAPFPALIPKLGELMAHGLMRNGRFDATAYDHRVKQLPSFIEDPETFKIMWNSFRMLNQYHSTTTASQLMVNIGNNWVKNNPPTTGGYIPPLYIEALVSDLLLPTYFMKLDEAYTAKGESIPDYQLSSAYADKNIAEMGVIAAEKLTVSLTLNRLLQNAERWQHNQFAIDAKKALLMGVSQESWEKSKMEWHPLIPEHHSDGYRYKALTSQLALSQEGMEMGNCVGGFRRSCQTGEHHILSGKAPDGERFTLYIHKENTVFEVQLSAEKGKGVSKQSKIAALQLVSRINNGDIAINPQLGSLEEGNDKQERIRLSEAREGIFHIYKDMQLLPKPFHRCTSLEDFLTKTTLGNEIANKVKGEVPPVLPEVGSWRHFVSIFFPGDSPVSRRGVS